VHDVRKFLDVSFNQPGMLLHIGYPGLWLDQLCEAGNEITVLEAVPNRITPYLTDPRVTRFVSGRIGDVQDVGQLFDYIWWWHGPEAFEHGDFVKILEKLKVKVRQQVVVFSGQREGPWRWVPTVQDFEDAGLETDEHGSPDWPDWQIVGWTP